MPLRFCYYVLIVAALSARVTSASESLPIEISPSANGMIVTAGGMLFAEYHTNSAGRPVLWPVKGPTGANMLREWPIGKPRRHEATDHPHHRGLWFGYSEVNGIDFWHNPGPPEANTGRGRIVHRSFETISSLGGGGVIVTTNDWLAPGGVVICQDERLFRFGATKDLRWIDFRILLKPVNKPLHIGDSKEGAFALRVAGPLSLDARVGGRIVNSSGQVDQEVWGQRAVWVDYQGRMGDDQAGVAVLCHPSNFRARPRWHVRGYGLLAVNPFGEVDFPKIPGYRQGPLTVNIGDPLQLRFRVILHTGDERQAHIDRLYRAYAKQ